MYVLSAVSLLRRWFTGEEHIDEFYSVKIFGRENYIFSRPFFINKTYSYCSFR